MEVKDNSKSEWLFYHTIRLSVVRDKTQTHKDMHYPTLVNTLAFSVVHFINNKNVGLAVVSRTDFSALIHYSSNNDFRVRPDLLPAPEEDNDGY